MMSKFLKVVFLLVSFSSPKPRSHVQNRSLALEKGYPEGVTLLGNVTLVKASQRSFLLYDAALRMEETAL